MEKIFELMGENPTNAKLHAAKKKYYITSLLDKSDSNKIEFNWCS